MISTLSLEIENKGNCNTFVITDSSFYNTNLPVTCGLLEIKPPGNCASVYFDTIPEFTKILNASLLQIQLAVNYESLLPLPDGIYYIKYSINPADHLYVEYYYLHNCNQYEEYIKKSCELFSAKCDLTRKEYNSKLEELRNIKDMIDASKYKAEYCGEPTSSKNLYDEINTQLKQFKVNGCSNC